MEECYTILTSRDIPERLGMGKKYSQKNKTHLLCANPDPMEINSKGKERANEIVFTTIYYSNVELEPN